MKNQYRIGDDTLLKINFGLSDRENFYLYDDGNNTTQYISELFNYNNIDKTVFSSNQRINKVFNSLRLIDTPDMTISNERIITGALLLRQGFSWENVFGLLMVIKTTGNQFTSKVLFSQIFDINDFAFDSDESRELINGSFWTKQVKFTIPNFEENLMVSIETIYFSDVIPDGNLIGKINNYPINDTNYEPLIGEEPIPDYIQTSIELKNNHYLKIQPITLENNKTLEQSILDYFNLTNNIVSITVEHIIKYGTDAFGYKTIRISNEDYKFGPILIGLDLTEFEATAITIFVSTEINCNNKLMKREQFLIFDYVDILNPIISNLVMNPASVFPVEFKTVQNITNTVIETKMETKIVPIFTPTFIEIVKENFEWQNKNISFEEIKIPSYMVIKTAEEQFILSKVTSEGLLYYDLASVIKPSEEVKYEIIDANTKKLIKFGIVTLPKSL
jgi:hypothetical protein